MRIRWILGTVILAFVCFEAQAQILVRPASVGVEPYRPMQPSSYRILAGGGVNAGLFERTPVTEFVAASIRKGINQFGATVLFNQSTGGLPRRTFVEYDLLYGYSYDLQIAQQGNAPNFYHLCLSTGLALDTYAERWRQSRRRVGDELSAKPNTFAYTAGIPVQLQASFEPGKYWGAGILAFANFNSISPNFGIAFGVEGHI